MTSAQGRTTGVRVVRAPDLSTLADHLAIRLRDQPPTDPFGAVEVAVPGRGAERWLTQHLAGVLGATAGQAGVCAGIGFPFVGGLVHRTVAAALGPAGLAGAATSGEVAGGEDLWSPTRLVWPLAELLDDLPAAAWADPLRTHLAADGVPALRRRLPLARRIADLFDRYALYRPELVAAWCRGEDVDVDGAPLAGELCWQPALWRAVTDRLGVEGPDRRTDRALTALREGRIADPDALPRDPAVFGVLGLPPRHLDVLVALGAHTTVSLYLLDPCPAWSDDEPTPTLRHPLLTASGLRARDAHTILVPVLPAVAEVEDLAGAGDGEAVGATVLEVLQADVRADRRRAPDGDVPARPLAPADRSIQVHRCHGPIRQLEVLREVLLGLLEDDPTLEPRDIVVLTPDIQRYAPLVPAAFPWGRDIAGEGHRPTGAPGSIHLDVRVADRNLAGDAPVTATLLRVLELATTRISASEVLDLVSTAPVRARFDLSAADLEVLPGWLQGTGVRWGMDAAHREHVLGIADGAHTFDAGLDRLALGAAMADEGDRTVGGIRPFDDVEGDRVELLGRLEGATHALFSLLAALDRPRTVPGWREILEQVLVELLDPGVGPGRDPGLVAELARIRGTLDAIVREAAGHRTEPTLAEIRGLLEERLAPGGRSVATGTGAITVTGLVSLRNLPHRVVCLVGMDDGALPRPVGTAGFDLLEAPSRPGDPDPRAEDRQLFLDAVLAATDHLVITYTGRDPRSNAGVQPAVVVAELMEVLAAQTSTEPGADGVPTWTEVEHPLQPHSARYFRDPLPGESPVPRGFDPDHLAAARAAAEAVDAGPVPGFLAEPLPLPPADLVDLDAIELEDLIDVVQHPVRGLLRRRLGLAVSTPDRRLEDRDPFELDGLERWQVGQELLERGPDGDGDREAAWYRATLARGTVPVGGPGEVALEEVAALAGAVRAEMAQVPGTPRRVVVEVVVPLPPHVPSMGAPTTARLTGSVTLTGDTLLEATVGRLRAPRQLAAWIRLLAVVAAGVAPEPRAVLLGRGKDDEIDRLELHAVTAERARELLGEVVELYLRAHRVVLPLLPVTGAVYAAARRRGMGVAAALERAHRGAWEGGFGSPGERDDPDVVQAFGRDTELADLDAWYVLTPDAERLWMPLLDAGGRA